MVQEDLSRTLQDLASIILGTNSPHYTASVPLSPVCVVYLLRYHASLPSSSDTGRTSLQFEKKDRYFLGLFRTGSEAIDTSEVHIQHCV